MEDGIVVYALRKGWNSGTAGLAAGIVQVFLYPLRHELFTSHNGANRARTRQNTAVPLNCFNNINAAQSSSRNFATNIIYRTMPTDVIHPHKWYLFFVEDNS